MSDTVLAALITGAATLIAGLIGGALAVYFALRGQKETALEDAQRREDEAQRREVEAQRKEEEAQRQAEQAHRREAVAYLMSIGDTIEGMRDQLAESQIPHSFGHQFRGLLNSYEGFLQPYLGGETQHELAKLKHRIQEKTEVPDAELQAGREVDPRTLRELLDDMDRVLGDVRAQATSIYATESRAD